VAVLLLPAHRRQEKALEASEADVEVFILRRAASRASAFATALDCAPPAPRVVSAPASAERARALDTSPPSRLVFSLPSPPQHPPAPQLSMLHQSKKRKSSVSSVTQPFDGPPSPAPSAASSSASSSSTVVAPPPAGGATDGSSSSTGRAGSAAPSTSHGGHPTVGGGVGELIGTGTGPGDVNEPGISLCVPPRSRPLTSDARARSPAARLSRPPMLTTAPSCALASTGARAVVVPAFFVRIAASLSRALSNVQVADPSARSSSRRCLPIFKGNRESAQRSRDAKKNHQHELEIRVAELEAQLAAALDGRPLPAASTSSTASSATTTTATRLPTPPPSSVKPPPSLPAADDGAVRRLALEKENADLRARVGKLEELVRGLVRLLGQAPAVEGSVVEPLAMGGLVDADTHGPSKTSSTSFSSGPSDAASFGTFTPEELAFAEHIVANATFPPAAAPAIGGASTFGYPPSPLELSPMDGLQSFDSPTGIGRFSSDFAPPAPASPARAPLSPDFAQFLNPFATAGEDESPLAGFEFVSDGLAPLGSPAARRGSSPMSDISFDSVSSVPTVDGFPGKTVGGCDEPSDSGQTVGGQTGALPSARWSTLPQQRVPSPLLLPSSNLASVSSPLPASRSAGRPLPALLRRTSSRPGSPMQISPPASPRTLPTTSTTTAASGCSATPLPRPGTPTLLLRSTSTASLHPTAKLATSTSTSTATTSTSAAAKQQPAASTSTTPDCGRSSRSALGRGSRHLQRVFSGTASSLGNAGPSTSSGPSGNASPSSSASSSSLPTRPPKLTRTNSSSSALRLSLPQPKRPISPTELGALGLECLTDFMAQHQAAAAINGSGSSLGSSTGSGGSSAGPTEKRSLAKQEFTDLGLGGMGSPRSVGCY